MNEVMRLCSITTDRGVVMLAMHCLIILPVMLRKCMLFASPLHVVDSFQV